MGRSRYKQHEPWYPYLLTSSFVHGLPLFSKTEIARYVIEAIKHHQSQHGLKIYAWCIMENHFHLIAEHEDLKICMQSIKSYTAKQILDLLKSKNNQLYLKQLAFSSKKRQERVCLSSVAGRISSQANFYGEDVASEDQLCAL